MLMQHVVIDGTGEDFFVVEEMHFLLIAHRDVRMFAQKIMERGRSRFCAPARMKSRRSILRRLVRSIAIQANQNR